MVMLTDDDRKRIAEAVASAEARSSGEIACVLSEEAAHYREVPIAWAAFAALVLPPIAVALGFEPEAWREAVSGWSAGQIVVLHDAVLAALAAYVIVQAIVFAVVALVAEIPAVRRLLTPRFVKRHRVREAAQRHFAALTARVSEGAYVLIYVSRLDRMVEIVTSPTAHRACDAGAWAKAAHAIGEGLRKDRAGDGFVSGIEICGAELAKHFPPGTGKRNALPDDVVEG